VSDNAVAGPTTEMVKSALLDPGPDDSDNHLYMTRTSACPRLGVLEHFTVARITYASRRLLYCCPSPAAMWKAPAARGKQDSKPAEDPEGLRAASSGSPMEVAAGARKSETWKGLLAPSADGDGWGQGWFTEHNKGR
jgi:hypothetical protein